MPNQAKKTEKRATKPHDNYRKGRLKVVGDRTVPSPQRERMKAKYVQGKSISQISREELREWHTVASIVKSEDMKNHVRGLREKWMAKMDDILLNAIQGALDRWNPELAFKMAVAAGIIPGGKNDILGNEPLTLDAAASSEDRIKEMAKIMVEGALRRQQSFNLPLPELDGEHVQEKQEDEEE